MNEQPEAGRSSPSTAVRAAIVVLVLAAVAAAFYLKPSRSGPSGAAEPGETAAAALEPGPAPLGTAAASPAAEAAAPLPRLIEFGRGQCIACKMMQPVLEEVQREYAGALVVESVNLDQAPEMAERFNIRLIPLQVFLDPEGNEVFRHEGFFSKEEIAAKWRELGFDLSSDSGGA